MSKQVPLTAEAIAELPHPDDGTIEIAPDLAYRRLAMVNVVFYGMPHCGDRNWVLIDTGVPGMTGRIISAAEERFGHGARPAAIILTHGHFDHLGCLEKLAEKWDAPVHAHPLETPYLNGRAAHPPPDPSVGGGLLPWLSPLFPTGHVNVADRLRLLPATGGVPGMPDWRWVHTPGHSPGHISLWREADATLIAGDAFITTNLESAFAVVAQAMEMHGPPQFLTLDWAAAGASVRTLAALGPRLVITGHGRAAQGPRMLAALRELGDRFEEIAIPAHGRYVDHPALAEDGTAYCENKPPPISTSVPLQGGSRIGNLGSDTTII